MECLQIQVLEHFSMSRKAVKVGSPVMGSSDVFDLPINVVYFY